MRHVTNGTFPRWAIWENVAGALSSNNGRDFAAVISEMAEAGAVLQEYALLDAQYFGIPQRRRRVFLVACFNPAIARNCPDPLLPVSESLRGDSKKGKSKRQAVASETSAGFTSSSFAQYAEGVGTLRSNGGDLGGGSETLIAEPMLAFDTQFGSNANVFENQSPTLKASQQSPSVAYDEMAFSHYDSQVSVGKVSPTLRSGTNATGHAVLEPTMAVRRLTPLECERLMGWPDDHTRWKADGTEQADTHRYKQCGNGVASPVARWIASHILKAHQ